MTCGPVVPGRGRPATKRVFVTGHSGYWLFAKPHFMPPPVNPIANCLGRQRYDLRRFEARHPRCMLALGCRCGHDFGVVEEGSGAGVRHHIRVGVYLMRMVLISEQGMIEWGRLPLVDPAEKLVALASVGRYGRAVVAVAVPCMHGYTLRRAVQQLAGWPRTQRENGRERRLVLQDSDQILEVRGMNETTKRTAGSCSFYRCDLCGRCIQPRSAFVALVSDR